MPAYQQEELDLFARALARALRTAQGLGYDAEENKSILMASIMEAAQRGVRDEAILTDAALAALASYEPKEMDAVMRQAPL